MPGCLQPACLNICLKSQSYKNDTAPAVKPQAVMTEAEEAAAAEDEAQAAAIARGAWAFQQLADDLCYDVLDPAWHVRHGAALALREVLRSQAGAAGIEAPVASEPSGQSFFRMYFNSIVAVHGVPAQLQLLEGDDGSFSAVRPSFQS
jgi:hypothetical protein